MARGPRFNREADTVFPSWGSASALLPGFTTCAPKPSCILRKWPPSAPAHTPRSLSLSSSLCPFQPQIFPLQGWITCVTPHCLLFVFASLCL